MTLTYDSWFDIMLELDYKELKQLCQNNTITKDYHQYISMICIDTHFWHIKMNKEFGVFKSLPGNPFLTDNSLLESYNIMTKAKKYEKDLDQIGMLLRFTISKGPNEIIVDNKSLPTPMSENATLEYNIYNRSGLNIIIKKRQVVKARAADETDYTIVKEIKKIIMSNKETFNLIYILTAYADASPKYIDMLNFHAKYF